MRSLFVSVLLLVSSIGLVGEEKQYPLTLNLLETDPSNTFDAISTVEASDGNTYEIECTREAIGQFVLGNTRGCGMQPGTYHARWDKGRLKISKGNSKEWTFGIRSSRLTAREEKRSVTPSATHEPEDRGGETAKLLLSSTPLGADIELDGSFIGQTPSTVPVQPGDHTVRITKSGFQPWEKQVKTSGGEVTIAAELESVPK
jgi:hypothetical protein